MELSTEFINIFATVSQLTYINMLSDCTDVAVYIGRLVYSCRIADTLYSTRQFVQMSQSIKCEEFIMVLV